MTPEIAGTISRLSARAGTAAALFLIFYGPRAFADFVTIAGAPVTQGTMVLPEREKERLERTGHGSGRSLRPAERFILQSTRVDVEISGVLARVRLEQVFQNPYTERLEALYVFPLPEDAAVDGYSFQIGETVIEGVVKTREEARREYEQARDEGRKGALLEQERPNIFSQAVANIPPGAEIRVHIRYVHPVGITDGRCLFRFPMVVAPRYIPGGALGRPPTGRGWSADTSEVPDASRVTPPVLPAGRRAGNDVVVAMTIDAGMPIRNVTAVTHEIVVDQPEPTRATVRLKNQSTLANKDFIVEYTVACELPVIATLTHRAENDPVGYVALFLEPSLEIPVDQISPRKIIFVLDRSGSMNGPSIAQLRIVAGRLLEGLNPQDTFRLIAFHSTVEGFRDGDTLQASPANLAAGADFIRGLDAGGGTELLQALRAALLDDTGKESGRPRYLFLLSDALVGNDDGILGFIGSSRFDDVRVFPIAFGAAPNLYLIRRAAELGRGMSMHVTNQDNATEMARRLREKTSSPFITDLELDWGALDVKDIIPTPLPDLHGGGPLVVMARYRKPGSSRIRLRGNLAGQAIAAVLELELPEVETSHDSLGTIWARRRIRQIWNRDLGSETREGRAEITRLGLEHQLVTAYTSFVAVETQAPGTVEGRSRPELVPTLLPEGMDELAASPESRWPPTPGRSRAGPGTPAPPPPPISPPPEPERRRSYGGGGGFHFGGGCVEWVFLAGVGLLVGARACRGRHGPKRG